jgi:hypothetical protein
MFIEQALYGSRDAAGYRFLARSAGFREDWLRDAQRLCTDFGERPAGVVCPDCVFAQPFGSRHVAVVQVTDRGADDTGRPGAMEFRLLILPLSLYADLGGDPFLIGDQFPPPRDADGELTALQWTAGPPPARTVASLRKVLDVSNSAVLLGGTQALLDGGRLVFERREPAGALVRSLWALLPTNSRFGLWPATFVFANASRFHVAVVPRADDPKLAAYVDEVRAGDYPEGRYELALQIAVESGDQEHLDTLLARRSRSQVLRLGLGLLAVLVLGPIAVGWLIPRVEHSAAVAKNEAPALRLPPVNECPRLDLGERQELATRLDALGRRLRIEVRPGSSEEALTDALAAVDANLGTPDPRRDPGPLRKLGPLQRQVRALLWKHATPGYDVRGMNTVELLDRLDRKLSSSTREGGRPDQK